MRILVVEDEPKLARLLRAGLATAGFEVDLVNNGADAVALSLRNSYSCVVLDVALPVLDGFATCARMRERRMLAPVIFLTARDAVEDRIRGLEAGADDYCVKPVSLEELIARIRAQARRADRFRDFRLEFGGLRLDPVERTMESSRGRSQLSHTEFALMRHLLEREGRVCTRGEILSAVWRRDSASPSNVVDVYVGYLRTKLAAIGDPIALRTVRGEGFTAERA